MNGGFTPLDSYMDRATYLSVCEKSQLPNGLLFPIPFVLEVPKSFQDQIHRSSIVTLTDDRNGTNLATVEITDLWDPDFQAEKAMYGGDPEHPEIQRMD